MANATRELLNGLSLADATAWYEFIRSNASAMERYNVPVPDELACYASIDPGMPDGEAWAEHITCHILSDQGAHGLDWSMKYPRFQLKFGARRPSGSVKTPAKKSAGNRLKGLLSSEAWSAIKQVATDLAGGKFAAPVHHIAYILRKLENPNDPQLVPLPEDLGAGTAIAHLCDNHRCCKKEHMQVKTQSANMSMQRCVGAVLFVRDGVICQVHHCPHYRVNPHGVVEQPDCAKLSVVNASGVWAIAPGSQQAFDAAKARYEAKVAALPEPELLPESEDEDFIF